MTYCLGIVTKNGLVMASDSRTNAGYDQINTCRKMHTFVQPGERVFVILTSGSLSCSQSIMTLLRKDFDEGERPGKGRHPCTRPRVSPVNACAKFHWLDREALDCDDYKFNVHLLARRADQK